MRASATNAHFTYDLYRPIWNALEWFGFNGGRVLEPAVGTGHALGFMDPTVRANSTLTASELDPTTAAIASYLYPSAKVQPVGYEQILLARNTQDLAISNVPFGRFKANADPLFAGPLQCIAREDPQLLLRQGAGARAAGRLHRLHHLAPHDGRARAHGDPALPPVTGAFRRRGAAPRRRERGVLSRHAKTQVVTDLIVLQKFKEGERAVYAQAGEPPTNADLFLQSPLQPQWSVEAGKDSERRRLLPAVNDLPVGMVCPTTRSSSSGGKRRSAHKTGRMTIRWTGRRTTTRSRRGSSRR